MVNSFLSRAYRPKPPDFHVPKSEIYQGFTDQNRQIFILLIKQGEEEERKRETILFKMFED
jgi:hypothetical protein